MMRSLFHKETPDGRWGGARTPQGRSGSVRRRTPIFALILLAILLFAEPSAAENPLLRGPRKPLRPAAAVEPAAPHQGWLEDLAAAPVLFYQRFIGPHLGRPCGYHPSCSTYSLLAIRKHGALVGTVMTFDRLQHEADEPRYSPLIRVRAGIRVYDPPENNDFWWHSSAKSAME